MAGTRFSGGGSYGGGSYGGNQTRFSGGGSYGGGSYGGNQTRFSGGGSYGGGSYGGNQTRFSGGLSSGGIKGGGAYSYAPDISEQQTQYQQSIAQLQSQAQGVQAAAGRASQAADFFSPERGQYIQGLKQLMTTGTSQVGYDPSYQFRFKQGQGAVESSLAAQGLLSSGSAGLELQQYGQRAASQEYQAQFERLFKLAGVSQSDPVAAARLQFEGAEAPFKAAGQISEFGFKGLQAERDRGFEQSQAAIKHQYDLQKLQFGNRGSEGYGGRDRRQFGEQPKLSGYYTPESRKLQEYSGQLAQAGYGPYRTFGGG